MTKTVTLRLPDETWAKLQENARSNEELPSEAARRLLRDTLKASKAKLKENPSVSKAKFQCKLCGKELPNRGAAGFHFQAHREADNLRLSEAIKKFIRQI